MSTEVVLRPIFSLRYIDQLLCGRQGLWNLVQAPVVAADQQAIAQHDRPGCQRLPHVDVAHSLPLRASTRHTKPPTAARMNALSPSGNGSPASGPCDKATCQITWPESAKQ